jgi:dienelactone hydrolase
MGVSPPTAEFRFYEAGHALNDHARRDRLDWLARWTQRPAPEADVAALPGYGITFMSLVVPPPASGRVSVRRDLEYARQGDRLYRLDCYAPAGKGPARRPAVILVHGVAHPALLAFAKDWEGYRGWGRLLAAEGFVAIVPNLGSPAAGPRPEQWYGNAQGPLTNLRELVAYVQRNAAELNVDPARLAVVAFSGGGNTGIGPALGDLPVPVRCVVGMYPVMDAVALQNTHPALGDDLLRVLSPARQLAARGGNIPPLFLVKAQHDRPELNGSIDAFAREAARLNAPVVLREVLDGHHGFDLLDDYAQTPRVIAEAVAFLHRHLQP